MDAFLATTFMRSHSSSDTRLGHLNESIIMHNALRANSKLENGTTRIDFACEVGLINSLEHGCLHASPDYLLLIRKGTRSHTAFAEIKCRTRVHTAAPDRELLDGFNTWINVEAGSPDFKRHVRIIKERFQLLHQAATLQLNYGLLLIGDCEGEIIRGIWIHFGESILRNYCKCVCGIYEKHLSFTTEALEGTQNAERYISDNTKEEIKEAIKKQEYVDMESFLYNFKFWVKLRRESLPLTTSQRCLPMLASLWNRSKNGSDVATGIMRSSWYPLPTQSRTPSALVVQRLLFLITINIMKIGTFLTFKNKMGHYEDIDRFRKRSNKMFGSHRAFLLHVRKRCIMPMIIKESERLNNIQRKYAGSNCEVAVTPQQLKTDEVRTVESRRETRSASKTKCIADINHCFKITETTPTGRDQNRIKAEQRLLKCTNPILGRVTGYGKKCIRCKRITRTVCLGCHQHMCMAVAKEEDIDKNTPDRFKEGATVIKVNLGSRKSRVQTDSLTPNGKRKRSYVRKNVELSIQGTCYNILHQHLLEKSDTSSGPAKAPHTLA